MLFISATPLPKIVMTLCVKNEADIIATNIEHHIEQGVSQFLITDNASTDNTIEIASKYKEVVDIFESDEPNHLQEKHVTHMARQACKLDPDWIIHADADELWENIREITFFDTFNINVYMLLHHIPIKTQINPSFEWLDSMKSYIEFNDLNYIVNNTIRIIHKPDPEIQISHGNHAIINLGTKPQIATGGIRIHHYPLRCYKQLEFKAKMYEGLASRGQFTERWGHWNKLYKKGTLLNEYIRVSEIFQDMVNNQIVDDRVTEVFAFHSGIESQIQQFNEQYQTAQMRLEIWQPKHGETKAF